MPEPEAATWEPLQSQVVLRTGTKGPRPRAQAEATWGTLLSRVVTEPGLEGGGGVQSRFRSFGCRAGTRGPPDPGLMTLFLLVYVWI